MSSLIYRRAKTACYMSGLTMSVIGNLPPLLFLTFHEMYGISYSLLGLLVLINFITQLVVDLLSSLFSYKFSAGKFVRIMPLFTAAGLWLYALSPLLFPNHVYVGLVLGTILFSASGGFVDLLLSPMITAIPADDPEREMSKLHSFYAWGVGGVILVATAFLLLFSATAWQWLILLFSLIPFSAAILFLTAEIPPLKTPERMSGVFDQLRCRGLWLCAFAMFLAGAVECTMAQWASGFLELALNIPKEFGDLFGVALFSVMLGLGRTLYTKRGKNMERVLLLGAIGSAVCYFVCAITPIPFLGLVACALTGFCASMLWPGSLLVATGSFPAGGLFVFAFMACGGDLGASLGPQLVGLVTDAAILHPSLRSMAESLSLSPEQLGMKLGMLIAMLFALAAIPVYAYLRRKKAKEDANKGELS